MRREDNRDREKESGTGKPYLPLKENMHMVKHHWVQSITNHHACFIHP